MGGGCTACCCWAGPRCPRQCSGVHVTPDHMQAYTHCFFTCFYCAASGTLSSCLHTAPAVARNLRTTCSQFKGAWGGWPPDGAWAAADALVTLAGFVADALADAAGTAAARSAAATAGANQTPAAAGSDAGTAAAGRSAAGDNTRFSAAEAACSANAHLDRHIDTAATQLVSPDLLRHAADGALTTAHWANSLVAAVQHSMPADGKGTDRQEKL
jgi:hypothetical protein